MNEAAYERRTARRRIFSEVLLLIVLFCVFCIVVPASAQDDVVKLVEEKRMELKAREDALKKEEERLNILRKDVDEKIDKYTKLLNRVDAVLKKAEQIQDERLLSTARLYEAMAPEAAAAQLSAMDTDMAAQILLRMKSKKAGPVIALVTSKKAVVLTKKMTNLQLKP
jgi:flagellar motility protein MotE (MotC chaperone)